MNTESRSFSNQGIKHTEGGWPKDVDPAEAEQTIRYRKKVEKDEEYLKQVSGLGEVKKKAFFPVFLFSSTMKMLIHQPCFKVMEHAIKQNNAIDIYEEYFVEEQTVEQKVAPPSAKITNVYR